MDSQGPPTSGRGTASRPVRPGAGGPAGASRLPARPGQPAGPRRPSPAVYRRRRLVALLVLLLVLAGIVWAVSALVGGPSAEAEPTTAEPTTAEPTVAEAAPTAPATPADPRPCEPTDLDVDLSFTPSAPSVTSGVRFAVALTNDGETPCLADAGADALVLRVSSGSDEFWSTEHCAEDAEEPLLLDAGASTDRVVRWTGARSAPGCPEDQPAAEAGTYRLEATWHGRPVGPAGGVAFPLSG